MAIDYGQATGSDFKAPVMRLDDKGHGFVGTVWDASTRQSTDFDSGKPKWFVNRKLVLSDEKPEGGQPVLDYIFHVNVEKGVGAFTKRNEDGEPVKLSSGKNAQEVRTVEGEDIAIVASAAWLSRLVKSERLNTGHRCRIERLTQARDENGDRMTNVDATLEILGTVENPQPANPERASVDYGDEGGEDAADVVSAAF